MNDHPMMAEPQRVPFRKGARETAKVARVVAALPIFTLPLALFFPWAATIHIALVLASIVAVMLGIISWAAGAREGRHAVLIGVLAMVLTGVFALMPY